MKIKNFLLALLLIISSHVAIAQIKFDNNKLLKPKDFKGKLNVKYKTIKMADLYNTKMFGNNVVKTRLIANPRFSSNFSVKPSISYAGKSGGENGMICTDNWTTLSATSSSFMASTTDSHINSFQPGAIYKAADFMNGIYNREIKNNRAPIDLIVSEASWGTGTTRSLSNPYTTTIFSKIGEMFQSSTGKTAGTIQESVQLYSSNNAAETAMMVSAGGSGYGASFNANYGSIQKDQTVNLTIDAYKSVYVISANPTGDDYFTAAPQGVKLNELLFLRTVSFGTRILGNVTIEFSSKEEAAGFAAKYSGFGYSANASLNGISIKKNTKIIVNWYQFGGPGDKGDFSIPLTNDVTAGEEVMKSMVKQINNKLNNVTYANAKPIRYTMIDLAGNDLGILSSTDRYKTTVCIPQDQPVTYAEVQITNGNDGKNDDNYVTYSLFSNEAIANKTHTKPVYSPILNTTRYLPEAVAEYRQTLKDEYEKATTTPIFRLKKLGGDVYMSSFMKDGGYLEIYTDHRNGKDDWDISSVSMKIYFAGNSTPIIMKWGVKGQKYRITKDRDFIRLPFSNTFIAKEIIE